MRTLRADVLRHLQAGPCSMMSLAAACGSSKAVMWQALVRMRERGLLVRTGGRRKYLFSITEEGERRLAEHERVEALVSHR